MFYHFTRLRKCVAVLASLLFWSFGFYLGEQLKKKKNHVTFNQIQAKGMTSWTMNRIFTDGMKIHKEIYAFMANKA